jgi:hypothetical protein
MRLNQETVAASDQYVLTALSTGSPIGRCTYSEETVMGCRYYEPMSAHGDFPDAAHCREASVISGSDHVRHTICRRRLRATVPSSAGERRSTISRLTAVASAQL